MSASAFPAALDDFPSAATIAALQQSDLLPTFGKHSGLLEALGSATEALEKRAFGQWINVKEKGAVGDGTTDDTTAITNAVSSVAATGGVVYLPPGTYKITSQITIPSIAGGGPSVSHPGVKILGAGPGATKINYTPAAATYCFKVGNDTTKSAENHTFENFSLTLSNTTAVGGININDPADYCVVRAVQFFGQGTSNGIGIALLGQTSANSVHLIEGCTFKSLSEGIRFSGFANSNLIQSCWFGVVTYGIRSEASGTDTLGGQTNVVSRCEFNGTTTTAIALRSASQRWTFLGVTCDGPTTSLDIQSSSDYNVFLGCVLPVVLLAGTSTDTNTFIGCNIGGNVPELILGDVRAWRSADNEITFGSGTSGSGGATLVSKDSLRAFAFRLEDTLTAGNTRWAWSIGSPAANDMVLLQRDPSAHSGVITVKANATDDLGLGYSGSKVGFLGATPVTRPTVTGSRGGNAALASLLTQLANLGLITDSSS